MLSQGFPAERPCITAVIYWPDLFIGSWRHGQPRLKVIPQHERDSQIAFSSWKGCDSNLVAESNNLSTIPQIGQATLHSLPKPPNALSFVILVWK